MSVKCMAVRSDLRRLTIRADLKLPAKELIEAELLAVGWWFISELIIGWWFCASGEWVRTSIQVSLRVVVSLT